jgi:NSS family neurotransmitter:Na+ symporter
MGGGCYVMIYLIFVTVVGYPLILGELTIGRNNPKGLSTAYGGKGRWQLMAPLSAFICFLVFCFYNVVAGWVVGYLWKTVNGSLFEHGNGGVKDSFDTCWDLLRSNWQSNLITTLVMLVAAMGINHAGVSEGIEKCAKILMPLFSVMLIGLIVYSLWLPGAKSGWKLYLYPDMQKLTLKGIARALAQSFMSLSAGMGTMVIYGCYVSRSSNLRKSAFVISVGDTLIAFMAGFFIFAFLGFLDFSAGGNGEHIQPPQDSTGLAFITLPKIFQGMPSGLGFISAASFFLLLIFAAITSSISLFEVPTRYLEERCKMSHSRAILLAGGVSFIISIACILSDGRKEISWMPDINLHDRFQDFTTCILMPLIALLTNIFLVRKATAAHILASSKHGEVPTGKFFRGYFNLTLKYISPCVILISLCISTYNFCFGS